MKGFFLDMYDCSQVSHVRESFKKITEFQEKSKMGIWWKCAMILQFNIICDRVPLCTIEKEVYGQMRKLSKGSVESIKWPVLWIGSDRIQILLDIIWMGSDMIRAQVYFLIHGIFPDAVKIKCIMVPYLYHEYLKHFDESCKMITWSAYNVVCASTASLEQHQGQPELWSITIFKSYSAMAFNLKLEQK